jgi:serine/threonine-protein kinase RsbW
LKSLYTGYQTVSKPHLLFRQKAGLAAEVTVRLDGSFPATTESVALARGILDRVTVEIGLSENERADLRLAFSEACANAVLHGSPRGDESRFHVCCELRDHRLIVEVRDEGRGFELLGPTCLPAGYVERGRGLFLMQQMVDCVEFDRQPHGMVVRLVKKLNGVGTTKLP